MKNIISRISLMGSCVAVATLVAGSTVSFVHTAHAANGKECYEQFNSAKKAGKLTEKNFKEYKAAHCSAKSEDATEKTTANEANKADKPLESSKKEKIEKAPVSTGNAVFPDKINPKYASEKEGTARMHTCQEQYNTNKASGKNGSLKWIQKGGGYYSECTKHLKAAATH